MGGIISANTNDNMILSSRINKINHNTRKNMKYTASTFVSHNIYIFYLIHWRNSTYSIPLLGGVPPKAAG